ncbi:hypothetical protein RGU39_21130 [Bacillus wiedmannii]|nr:hypothetical protein [Bacillus wiedmannii]MDR4943065.1 hypothetical protein [Bacillus wiedmannii]
MKRLYTVYWYRLEISNTKDEQGQVYTYSPISSIANITGKKKT